MSFLLVAFGAAILGVVLWRFLMRSILALSLSLLGGTVVGALLTDGDIELVITSVIVALALIYPTYLYVKPHRARHPSVAVDPTRVAEKHAPVTVLREADIGEVKARSRSKFLARKRRSNGEAHPTAWDELADAADGAAARIAVLRRSCERLRTSLKNRAFDPAAHDQLVMLERTIPSLIMKDLGRVRGASEPERTRIISTLIDLLEDFAAECERQQTARIEGDDLESTILRSRIRSHLDRNSLSPLS